MISSTYVAQGRCRLAQALIKDKRFEELYLLPAAQTKDKHAVSPEQRQGRLYWS